MGEKDKNKTSTKKSRRSKRLIRTLIFSAAILLLINIFFSKFYSNRVIGPLLKEVIQSYNKDRYLIDYNEINLNIVKGELTLTDFVVNPAPTLEELAYTAHINIPKIEFGVYDLSDLVFKKELRFSDISIIKPDITIDVNEAKTDTVKQTQKNVYNYIQGYLRLFSINSFNLEHGKFAYLQTKQPFVINDISFRIDALQIDSSQNENWSYINLNDIDLIVKDQVFEANENERLAFKEVNISTSKNKITIDSLLLKNNAKPERTIDFLFPKLTFTGVNFDTLYNNDFLDISKIVLNTPTINYSEWINEELMAKRKVAKKLFQGIRLDTLMLDSGYVEYSRTNQNINRSLNFKNINVLLTYLDLDPYDLNKGQPASWFEDVEIDLTNNTFLLADSVHEMSIENINISKNNRVIELNNLVVNPRTGFKVSDVVNKNLFASTFNGEMKKLALYGLDVQNYYVTNELNIDDFIIEQPDFLITQYDSKKTTKKRDKQNYADVKRYFDKLEFNKFDLKNGNIVVVQRKYRNHQLINLRGFNFHTQKTIVDSAAIVDPLRLLDSLMLNAEVKSLAFSDHDSATVIKLEGLRMKEYEDLNASWNNLHVMLKPAQGNLEYLRFISSNGSLSNMNFSNFFRQNSLVMDTLDLNESQVTIVLAHKDSSENNEQLLYTFNRIKTRDCDIDIQTPGWNSKLSDVTLNAGAISNSNSTKLPEQLLLYTNQLAWNSKMTNTSVELGKCEIDIQGSHAHLHNFNFKNAEDSSVAEVGFNDLIVDEISIAKSSEGRPLLLIDKTALKGLSIDINSITSAGKPFFIDTTRRKIRELPFDFKINELAINMNQLLSEKMRGKDKPAFFSIGKSDIAVTNIDSRILNDLLFQYISGDLSSVHFENGDNKVFAGNVSLTKKGVNNEHNFEFTDLNVDIKPGDNVPKFNFELEKLNLHKVKLDELIDDTPYLSGSAILNNLDLTVTVYQKKDTARERAIFEMLDDPPYQIKLTDLDLEKAKISVDYVDAAGELTELDLSNFSLELENFYFYPGILYQKLLYSDYFNLATGPYRYTFPDQLNYIQFDDLSLNSKDSSVLVKNLKLRPLYEKFEYGHIVGKQTDWMNLDFNNITFDGLDIDQLSKQSGFSCQKILLDSFNIFSFRDKNIPFDTTQRRELPNNYLMNLSFPVRIDSVQFKNGSVTYQENEANANRPGIINFQALEGSLANVNNRKDLDVNTSVLNASATLYGRTPIQIRSIFNSINDVNTFSLQAYTSNLPLGELNKMLVPLNLVEVTDGKCKKLYMDVSANDDFGIGVMDFYYDDLRIQLINRKKQNTRGMGPALGTFFANAFVLNSSNPHMFSFTNGEIFFERDKRKSIFNYWVKLFLSGVISSIGAKNNNTEYKKMVKTRLDEIAELENTNQKDKKHGRKKENTQN